MKLSAHQAHILVTLLKDSLSKDIAGVWSLDNETRRQLFNEIVNQQSRELVDLDKAEELE